MKRTGWPAVLALLLLWTAGCEKKAEDGTEFRVIKCFPGDQQTNVPLGTTITIRFTHQVDHRTVQGTRQIILADQQNSVIPVSYQFKGEYVTLTPGSPLSPNATYGVAVRPGVRDIYGANVSPPFEVVFSTGPNLGSIPNWPPFQLPTQPTLPSLGPPGTFTPVGSLFVPRARHTATRLNDGRVLVAGGESGVLFTPVQRTAEIYDPATTQWTPSQSNNGQGMYFKRAGHTATLLDNGKVLLTGGTPNGLQAMDTAELYDPLTDRFTVVPGMMNFQRMFHTATKMGNGNVLLVSGATTATMNPFTGTMLTDTLEVYDVYSGSFQACPAILTPLAAAIIQQPGGRRSAVPLTGTGGVIYHTATLLLNGNVLITGGIFFFNAPAVSQDVHIYVPGTGVGFNGNMNYNASRALTIPRAEHTATLLPEGDVAGLVIISGGIGTSSVSQSAEIFDPLSTNPTQGYQGTLKMLASNLTNYRRSHTATYIPKGTYAGRNDPWGKILVVGGSQQRGQAAQNAPYPPHYWPFLEAMGCGGCSADRTADLFDPYAFGQNFYLPYGGVDQTGQFAQTQDQQGNPTVVPNCPYLGLYWHAAAGLTNGSVLITGGYDCVGCMMGPAEGQILNGCCVYNP